VTEEEILYRTQQKDLVAQNALYQKYQHIWFSICLRYRKDRDDAADMLQNALINIYSKLGQFNPEKGSFKSWSCAVVVNESLMFLRKKGANFSSEEISAYVHISDKNETPIERMSAQELVALIKTIPDGYRTVFNLYVMDGYSHVEIADMLQISVGTSKSQLFKARKFLKQKLEVMV